MPSQMLSISHHREIVIGRPAGNSASVLANDKLADGFSLSEGAQLSGPRVGLDFSIEGRGGSVLAM
jgi:hypothetical protein